MTLSNNILVFFNFFIYLSQISQIEKGLFQDLCFFIKILCGNVRNLLFVDQIDLSNYFGTQDFFGG